MSDETNLPDRSENNPLSNGNPDTQLVCDLHVKGSEVYLPKTKPVDFKTKEYDKLFLMSLPDDIASDVSSVLKTKRSRFTIVKLAIVFLFLSTVAWAIYCFFPKTHISATSEVVSQDGLTLSSKYKEVTNKAIEESKKKQWKSVIDILCNHAKKISDSKEQTLGNELLLRIYFDAVHNCVDAPIALKDEAKSINEQVRRYSPDRLGWFLDWLRLNYPEECNYLSNGRYEPNVEHAKNIKELLQNVNPDRWRNAPDYEPNNKILDLYWARLNYAYWCYLNPRKNLNMNSAGVNEREEAYHICKKYTDFGECDQTFLRLKIDIIKRTIDAGIGISEGWYYFDGDEHWKTSYLKSLLDQEQGKENPQ